MSASDAILSEHEALVAELRAGTLDAPDHLHRRVLAARSERRSRRLSMPKGRRLVLVVVPVAAGLAVGAALIHGAFFAGNNPSYANAPLAAGRATKPEIVAHVQRSAAHGTGSTAASGKAFGAQVDKEAAPLARYGSSGKLLQGQANDLAIGKTPTAANRYSIVTIPTNRLVHADASLQVIVPSHAALTKATNQASQIATQLGGYAQNIQYQTSRSGDGNAYLDLRVPVGKAETAIGRLGALGRLVSQQVATQDLQQTFTKQTNRIGSLKRAIAIYEQALSSGSVSGSQRVEVEIRLSSAEHALTAQRKARGATVASGATADIQLQLTTNQHAFVGVHHKTGRLGRLLHNARDFLGLEGVIVLYALIVAGPFVILGLLAWWLTRERRRRDERRLLANA